MGVGTHTGILLVKNHFPGHSDKSANTTKMFVFAS